MKNTTRACFLSSFVGWVERNQTQQIERRMLGYSTLRERLTANEKPLRVHVPQTPLTTTEGTSLRVNPKPFGHGKAERIR